MEESQIKIDEINNSPLSDKGNTPTLQPEDEIIDMSSDFAFEDYQVVRREFFAHQREPAIVFTDCKFYVNNACLVRFPQFNSAQVLINKKRKILVLRPCNENEKDSYIWCNESHNKRKPKSITCKLFYAQVFELMGWQPNYKYKILGKLIHANGEYLIVFDLMSTEIYKRTIVEGQKPIKSRTPVYPLDWQNQFGLPFTEHQKAMQINIFDGYAVYSLKELNNSGETPPPTSEGINEH